MRNVILFIAVLFGATAFAGQGDYGKAQTISALNTELAVSFDSKVPSGSSKITRETANAIYALTGSNRQLGPQDRVSARDVTATWSTYLSDSKYRVRPGTRGWNHALRVATIEWIDGRRSVAEEDLFDTPPGLHIVGGDKINPTARVENTGERALAAHVLRSADDMTTGGSMPAGDAPAE